jgi:DNA-binding LacI/PurR family transcriptional regulator
VRQPAYELGFNATQAVLAALRGEALPEGEILPAELIVRESCGANVPLSRREGSP